MLSKGIILYQLWVIILTPTSWCTLLQ